MAKTTSKQPAVGIAIVTWNNASIVHHSLESIRNQTYGNITTTVLDNGSSDKTADLIQNKFPWVNVVRFTYNSGFSKGNNEIIKRFMKDKSIDYVVLLNSDASLDPKWVEEVIHIAKTHKKLAFAQGVTLDFFDHKTIDSTHVFINQKGQSIQSGYRKPYIPSDLNLQRVFGVNAAACLISRSFLENQPFNYLFDEDFFMYLEDVDVAARSMVLGWENFFVPKAIAYHMGSASSSKNPGFSVYMVNRNMPPMLLKNLPIGVLVKIFPRMVVADINELYRIVRGRNYKVASKFIQGRIKGLILCPKYRKKRKIIAAHQKIDQDNLWQTMRDGIIHKV